MTLCPKHFIISALKKVDAPQERTLGVAFENMPLKFSTEPDSLIRVLMTYKGLKNPIKVQEQKLKTPERNGFVAVEWGGTEIN